MQSMLAFKNENDNANICRIFFATYQSEENKNFPGHAFIIWKCGNDDFLLIQSYIDLYPMEIRKLNAANFLVFKNNWNELLCLPRINDSVCELWKLLTRGCTKNLKGSVNHIAEADRSCNVVLKEKVFLGKKIDEQ